MHQRGTSSTRAVANRRRTQVDDFENLEIAYPPTRNERHGRIAEILKARAASILAQEMLRFSNIVDGRGRGYIEAEKAL